jgi:hypothetical protein
MKPIPMLNIDKGEEIIHGLVSSYVPGTGYYKFLSKQKSNGTYEWVHFVERVNGNKEKMYRGDAKTKEELETVLEVMSKTLTKVFGAAAEMKTGKTEVRTTDGIKGDESVN